MLQRDEPRSAHATPAQADPCDENAQLTRARHYVLRGSILPIRRHVSGSNARCPSWAGCMRADGAAPYDAHEIFVGVFRRVRRRRLRPHATRAARARGPDHAAVHLRVALRCRRSITGAARRHLARTRGHARDHAERRVGAAAGAGARHGRARPARDPRHGGDVPDELRLPRGDRFSSRLHARSAVSVVGDRVRLRRARRAALRLAAARPRDVHGARRESRGSVRHQALASGLALRRRRAADLPGTAHVGARAPPRERGAGCVDAGGLPSRRLAALRGGRPLGAFRQRVDVAERAGLAPAAAA